MSFNDTLVFDDTEISDVNKARRLLFDYGCLVIRRFLPADEVASFSLLSDQSFDAVAHLLDLVGIGPGEPAANLVDVRLRDVVVNIRKGQMQPAWFTILNGGRSIYDLLKHNARAWNVVTRLLGGEWYPGAGNVRRVSPNQGPQAQGQQGPIAMHCDGPHLSRHAYSLNIWIPMTNCGEDAPGIQLVPGPFKPLQQAVKHDLDKSYVDSELELKLQRFYDAGEDGLPRFAPVLQQGDVVIFHNWIMHGTYWTNQMTRTRTSFELRFNAPTAADFECFGEDKLTTDCRAPHRAS